MDTDLWSRLYIEKLLKNDLYATFKGVLNMTDAFGVETKKNVVVKFFTESSDANNEYEFLQLMKGDERYPQPYYKIEGNWKSITVNFGNYDNVKMKNVFKIIVYEYIEGASFQHRWLISSLHDINKIISDISKYIEHIHGLGFIYADIRLQNIVMTPSGNYQLIDFGRIFSEKDPRFPPMDYMIDDEIPTMKDDISALEKIKEYQASTADKCITFVN